MFLTKLSLAFASLLALGRAASGGRTVAPAPSPGDLPLRPVTDLGGTPLHISLQYEHDFADDEMGPSDMLRLILKLLAPR